MSALPHLPCGFNPVKNQYHFLCRFRDGKLLEFKEHMDTERVTDIHCGGHRPPAVP